MWGRESGVVLWQVLSRGGEPGGAVDTARGGVCVPLQTARSLSTLRYGRRVGVPPGVFSSRLPPPSSETGVWLALLRKKRFAGAQGLYGLTTSA